MENLKKIFSKFFPAKNTQEHSKVSEKRNYLKILTGNFFEIFFYESLNCHQHFKPIFILWK